MFSFLSVIVVDSLTATPEADTTDDASVDAVQESPTVPLDDTLLLEAGPGISSVSGGDFTDPVIAPSDEDPLREELVGITVDFGVLEGADAQAMTAMGFRTVLGVDDTLELNLGPEIAGRILSLEVEEDLSDHGSAHPESDNLAYSLRFYVLPDGVELPSAALEGSEAQLIETFGLQKLGEVDLGRFHSAPNDAGTELEILADTRQSELPEVVSDRAIVEHSAYIG